MWRTLPRQSIFVRSVALVIFEIVLFTGIMPFLCLFGNAWSFAAAGAAVGLCMTGAILALCMHYVFRDPKSALKALLLGMAVNMGIPLIFGVAIQVYGGPLSESGFLYYLLCFYLLTLALKTLVTLPLPRQSDG